MKLFQKLQCGFRALFQKRRLNADMDEEMRVHIDMRIRQNIAAGMSPEEARYSALRQFGWVESIKETCRDQRGVSWIEHFGQDVRFGVRILRKNPGFTAVAVLTLALGIGANTAMFSFVNAVLLHPPPFKDPDRLVTVWERNPEQGYEQNMAATGTFLDWQEQNRSFEELSIFWSNLPFLLSGNLQSQRTVVTAVSANLFHLLGVVPQLGRTFVKDEEATGRNQVAILSDGFWKRRFGRDPNIMGKTITLDGQPFTVVGVMPSKFKFPGMTGVLFAVFVNQPPDLWVPMALNGEARNVRGSHNWQVLGRLKPGVTLAQAAAEMDALQKRLAEQHRGDYMGTQIKLVPLRAQGVANVRLGLLILLGAVAMLLLIACANVANLFLARATARSREIAVRMALGAARSRIIRQLLTESVLLALLGAFLGIIAAKLGIGTLVRLVPAQVAESTPGWEAIRLDLGVLVFTFMSALVTAVLFGLAPASQVARTELHGSLKEGSRGMSAGSPKQKFRSMLVSAEVALTMVLLLGAGLLIQSFSRLQRVNPGFQPARLLTMQVELPDSKYPKDVQKAAFFDRLLERVKGLPEVETVGMTLIVPFGGGGYNYALTIEGREKDAAGKIFTADWRPITPNYFRTLGVPLVHGRMFNDQNRENTQKVILVNEAFVRAFLPGQEPLGKRVSGFGDGERVIVGVVHDFKQWLLDSDVRVEMYTPQAQTPWGGLRTLVVRTTHEPTALASMLRSEVRALDPELPIPKFESMETLISHSVAQPRFRTFLLSLFAGLGLMLAAIGIYGVIAYSVSQRVQEIGIRIALGARGVDILRLVVGHGLRLTLIGVCIGLAGAVAVTRLLKTLLFEIKPFDPLTFLAVTVVLSGVALMACYFPARRATKVDPMVALRYE